MSGKKEAVLIKLFIEDDIEEGMFSFVNDKSLGLVGFMMTLFFSRIFWFIKVDLFKVYF